MDNYKEKNPRGYTQGNGNRERSYEGGYKGGDRKPRTRFNNEGESRHQYVRVERRDSSNSGSQEGARYNGNRGERPQRTQDGRYDNRRGGYGNRQYGEQRNNRPARQGAYRGEGFDGNGENSGNNRGGYSGYNGNRGNGGRGYTTQHRSSYAQQGGRQGNYDPNSKYTKRKRVVYREAAIDPDAPIRLNKYLANAGVCSRREADNYITAGLVSVNGTVVTELGTKVTHNDDIRFNGERVSPERKVYVLLNKPKDCVTTVDDPQERRTVLDCLKGIGKERIYPVGRLDRNTTGVLLLTNDGDMASRLTHPKFMKKKIYHVTCDKNVAMSDMDLLASGIELEDGPVYADEVSYVNDADRSQIGIEIHSGKNRIVRRMMEHLGYHVVKLDRVLFAGLTKKNLKRGDWRYLTDKEVNMLRMGAYE